MKPSEKLVEPPFEYQRRSSIRRCLAEPSTDSFFLSRVPLRFNAHGPEGLIDGKAPGNQATLGEAERRALKEIVESGPIPAVHGVVRWRLKDLVQWLFETFRISLSETTVSRELKRLGFAKLSARPHHHAQNEETLEAFKRTSPPNWQNSRRACRPTPR